MEQPILIAASSLDEHAYAPVRDILERKGYPVIVYRTDMVLSGEERLCLEITKDGELSISYDDQPIAADEIGAAWFRKIANFSLSDVDDDRAKQLYVNNEVKLIHDTLWTLYPEDIWLNAPEKMRQADRKLGQLLLAHELGFSIPQTVVGSHWEDISNRLLSDHDQMVVKMVRGVISENDKIKALYTTVLDQAKIDDISSFTTPYPGIYQPFLEKFREWRVTVVGDNIFSAAVYTDKPAKSDWRLYQLTNAVQFRHENLPAGIDDKCRQYLGRTGLKFGAFDFIEKPDGEIVFLECNPNGQYGWLEDTLGFPIAATIAEELVKIARKR